MRRPTTPQRKLFDSFSFWFCSGRKVKHRLQIEGDTNLRRCRQRLVVGRSLRRRFPCVTLLVMSLKLLFAGAGMVLILFATPGLRADVLEMQNGDRYSGKVISVTPDTVVLTNEMLGKITVLRGKVAN